MKTPFVLLTTLLAGTVLFLGTIAWRQHSELIRLRAAALDQGDRAALQKRIRDAEKRAQLSEARALAAQPANTETTAEPTDPAATAQLKNLPPADKKGPSPQEILAFLSNPEMQLKLATKFREQVDARYSTLFKNLNLSGPQQAQMRELLIERQGAVIDVAAAMLAAGGKLKEKDLQTSSPGPKMRLIENCRPRLARPFSPSFKRTKTRSSFAARRAIFRKIWRAATSRSTPAKPSNSRCRSARWLKSISRPINKRRCSR